MSNYFKRVAIAADQLLAAALFGTMPDETISAMAHRRKWKRFEIVINAIFMDSRHCEDSYIAEQLGKHLPDSYKE